MSIGETYVKSANNDNRTI